MAPTPEAYVTVVGDHHVRIPVPLPAGHGHETATVKEAFRCSTGDITAERWTGLAVGPLLLDAGAPDRTTHVQLTGVDRNVESEPRFAAPGLSGTRTVKRVRRIVPVTLDPGEHPGQWEHLELGAAADK